MTRTETVPNPSSTDLASPVGTRRLTNVLIRTFIAVAIVGWATSLLLTAIHFWVLPLPEGAQPEGAIKVITSPWAYVGPLPLATIGALYYLTMILAGASWLHTKDARLEKLLLPFTSLGVLSSAYFVYLQLVPIGAICPFCMVSATATTTLLILEIVIRRRGGAAAAPAVPATRVWPVTFVATMLTTLAVLWALPQLPLPGN
ncbi:MAG: vitamin K epoxide reductase family protein [Nitriliruptoraceae bacterium]